MRAPFLIPLSLLASLLLSACGRVANLEAGIPPIDSVLVRTPARHAIADARHQDQQRRDQESDGPEQSRVSVPVPERKSP
ncbi:MAG: hypothetical protein VKP62_01520 [Candidatus Sericytochromatia bacterium]|nr:hypothetical protein [Candidatus Sericytochromatia bacterium]